MPADTAVLMLQLPAALHEAFMAEAEASHRSPGERASSMIEEFVDRQRDTPEFDAWFRAGPSDHHLAAPRRTEPRETACVFG